MPSTPNLKLSDDPHDIVVVTPDPVRVAPADEELSSLLQEAAARHFSNPPTSTRSGSPASPAVDTTFRPTAVNDALAAGAGRSMGRRALRAFVTLLLAGCIGLAAVAWRAYGDAAKKQIAKLTTQVFLTPSLSSENPAPAAQPAAPAVTADAANAAAPQPQAPAQSAAQAVAPAAGATAADSAQLQSMARDLASMGQEMEQLKASIEQLKASQQQASREMARVPEARAAAARPSEQNVRPRTPTTISAISAAPRPAEARPRRPAPSSQATAPPPAPAPYYASRQPDYAPRQPDYAPRQIPPPPQVMADPPPLDPELTPVPRPPMPLR
jgi:hypothetical protein